MGSVCSELLSGYNILTYFTFALVPFIWWVLLQTRFGLRLGTVGENPEAVDTAGISVEWLRYRAVMMCGVLCAIAGSCLATVLGASFLRGMTAGKVIWCWQQLFWASGSQCSLWQRVFFCLYLYTTGKIAGGKSTCGGRNSRAVCHRLAVYHDCFFAGLLGKVVASKADDIPYVKER